MQWHGPHRQPEIVALHLIRSIEARAAGGFMKGVRVELHPELADFFQNERREQILRLEQEFDLKVEVIAASNLHRPQQEITWFAKSAQKSSGSRKKSTIARPTPSRRASPSKVSLVVRG